MLVGKKCFACYGWKCVRTYHRLCRATPLHSCIIPIFEEAQVQTRTCLVENFDTYLVKLRTLTAETVRAPRPDPEFAFELFFFHTDFFSFQNCSFLRFPYQSGSLNLHFEVRLVSEVQTHKREMGEFLNASLAKICSRKALEVKPPNYPPPHAQSVPSPASWQPKKKTSCWDRCTKDDIIQ